MPEGRPAPERRRARGWPQSLLGRLTLVMALGVLLTQLAANLVWARHLRTQAEAETVAAAEHLGRGAANAVRYFASLPPSYRPLVIQQLREMGGTRFFASLARAPVAVAPIAPQALAERASATVLATLKAELPLLHETRLAFAAPERLAVPEGERVAALADLPEQWVRHILFTRPEPAPVLVIQTELEPGHWLFLASLMPNPHFLQAADPLGAERLLLQGLPVAALLVLLIVLVLRWITRPLAQLSEAARASGQDGHAPPLPETGAREFVDTARAFGAMRQRIQQYVEDRERLFIGISHDLRTPITRLKLRAEMLDDDALRAEFEEDLDELDMMVKGALQSVKDSEIHEDVADVRLDPLVGRLVRGARLAGRSVRWREGGLVVRAKPLALKRALGNLLDNALHYGGSAEIEAEAEGEGDGGGVLIRIRDHGPGIPPEALHTVFEPHVRLAHGRGQNEGGLGLGLGIARSIVQAQGGELRLANHPEGGLVATVRLPG